MKNKLIILFICILISSIISCCLGPDGCWDFYAYHYYNGYAIINNKIDYNIMPAGIHSFFNPILDTINYLIITIFNSHKYMACAIKGIPWGVLVFLIYSISNLLFSDFSKDKYLNNIFIIFSTIVGATECLVISEIGTSQHDIPIAIFILSSLYLLLKYFKIPKNKYIIISGILAGIACGLKLTATPYALALILTFIILNFKKGVKFNLKCFSMYSIFAALGFLIIDGYWMLLLYKKFGNPFFPMFNAIFKSKYYAYVNYKDTKCIIDNIVKVLFYPLIWTDGHKNRVCEAYFFDFRHSFTYFSCIFLSILFFIKFKTKKLFSNLAQLQIFILLFFITSYLLWIGTSSLLRYFIPAMSLCGILMAIFISNITFISKNKIFTTISLLIVLIAVNTKYITPDWGRLSDSFKVPDLPIEDDSVVFLFDRPISYIAANNKYKNVRFIFMYSGCVDGEPDKFKPSSQYYDVVNKLIKNKKKYLIKRVRFLQFACAHDFALQDKHLKHNKCKQIKDIVTSTSTAVQAENFVLCEVE